MYPSPNPGAYGCADQLRQQICHWIQHKDNLDDHEAKNTMNCLSEEVIADLARQYAAERPKKIAQWLRRTQGINNHRAKEHVARLTEVQADQLYHNIIKEDRLAKRRTKLIVKYRRDGLMSKETATDLVMGFLDEQVDHQFREMTNQNHRKKLEQQYCKVGEAAATWVKGLPDVEVEELYLKVGVKDHHRPLPHPELVLDSHELTNERRAVVMGEIDKYREAIRARLRRPGLKRHGEVIYNVFVSGVYASKEEFFELVKIKTGLEDIQATREVIKVLRQVWIAIKKPEAG